VGRTVKITRVTPKSPPRLRTRDRILPVLGRRCVGLALLAAAALCVGASGARAAEIDWTPFAEEDVVEILTVDPDGEARETKVWVVVVGEAAYVRTNDSRWLANIRRDPLVRVRVRERELPLRADEGVDRETRERVEEAFKTKYGFMQRVMSALRLRDPTVLRLDPRDP
jgi:6-phosphofructokinase